MSSKPQEKAQEQQQSEDATIVEQAAAKVQEICSDLVRGHPRRYRQKDWRADVAAAVGEFIGTFTFLLLGLGGIQSAHFASPDGSAGAVLMEAIAMGAALCFTAWVFFRVTGAAFNPCVALTLFLLKAISPTRFILYSIAQLLGGIAAAAVLRGLLPGPLTINCGLSNGTTISQGVFIEMFLTFALCITVVMTAVEKNKATAFTPLPIGIALFSTQLVALSFTGAAVNTARAFGVAVVTGTWYSYHYIYMGIALWLGPALGAVLAAAMYKLLLFVHFWELNPDVDELRDDFPQRTNSANTLVPKPDAKQPIPTMNIV